MTERIGSFRPLYTGFRLKFALFKTNILTLLHSVLREVSWAANASDSAYAALSSFFTSYYHGVLDNSINGAEFKHDPVFDPRQ